MSTESWLEGLLVKLKGHCYMAMRTILIKMWDFADDPLSVMTTPPLRDSLIVDEKVSDKVIKRLLIERFKKMLDMKFPDTVKGKKS